VFLCYRKSRNCHLQTNHRDTENAEMAQKTQNTSVKLSGLGRLCGSSHSLLTHEG
jgi:hypothetical protein